jgi:catechol 2,3-dioxygenase-like lactoylglutathione lyase family enzyme
MDMQITGLGHAGIATHDLDACRRFYAEVLGMQLVRAQESENLRFRVNEHEQFFVRKACEPATTDPGLNRMRHIAFIVGNTPMKLDEAARHLDSYRIEYQRVAHEEHESLYCRDPDGHLIELYYWPSW